MVGARMGAFLVGHVSVFGYFLCISNIALGLGGKVVAGGILFNTVVTSPCGNLD